MIFAVLASGPGMSQELADSVRGKCSVVAVSDSWRLAPWADALVSADAGWWRHSQPVFHGKRYTLGTYPDTEKLLGVPMGTNSGLLGIHVAVLMGATKVLLLGVDLHGSHFFGPHLTLRNTRPERTAMFHRQFAEYKPKGVTILNCNPESKLTCYPMARLGDHLEGMAEPAAPDSGEDNGVSDGPRVIGLRSPVRGHFRSGAGRPFVQLESHKGRGQGG